MTDDAPRDGDRAEDTKAQDERSNRSRGELLAQCAVAPTTRHGIVCQAFSAPVMGDEAYWGDFTAALGERCGKAGTGDRRVVSDMLIAQAVTLDTVFTEMLRRFGVNLVEYPQAAERYMHLALKAQANSRATLEALARLHQPREQTVKHVHVNPGGQAVVADEFHHHTGGQNAESVDQPHACGTALPGPDAARDGVPLSRHEGKEAVPAAWREVNRGAEG